MRDIKAPLIGQIDCEWPKRRLLSNLPHLLRYHAGTMAEAVDSVENHVEAGSWLLFQLEKKMFGDPNGIQVEHLREWLSALETLKKAGIGAPGTNPVQAENARQT